MRKTWNFLNKSLGRPKSKNKIDQVYKNGNILRKKSEIAENLNEFFASFAEILDKTLPPPQNILFLQTLYVLIPIPCC